MSTLREMLDEEVKRQVRSRYKAIEEALEQALIDSHHSGAPVTVLISGGLGFPPTMYTVDSKKFHRANA